MATGNLLFNGEILTFNGQNLTYLSTGGVGGIGGGGGGFGGAGGEDSPPQPTFGLPADVVALIVSRHGSVANYLRLRNQGQI